MKKFAQIMFAMIVMVTIGVARAGEPVQDSVLVGKQFTTDPVDIYRIEMNMLVNYGQHEEESQVEAWILPDGNIIIVRINGETVLNEDDAPVQTLPRPINGEVEYAWVYVEGFNETGDIICHGYDYAHAPTLEHRFQISLMIRVDELTLLGVHPPAGVPSNDTHMTINGYGQYRYDANLGGYWIWLDPTLTGQVYEIWYNGQIIASGTIDVRDDPSVPERDKGFSMGFQMPAGVSVVDMRDPQRYQVVLKGMTTENGQTSLLTGENEEAKVFSILRREDAMQYETWVQTTGLRSAKVTVFAVDDWGRLVQIADTTKIVLDHGGWWEQINFGLYSVEYRDLILVLTELEFLTPSRKAFEIQFGGGKG